MQTVYQCNVPLRVVLVAQPLPITPITDKKIFLAYVVSNVDDFPEILDLQISSVELEVFMVTWCLLLSKLLVQSWCRLNYYILRSWYFTFWYILSGYLKIRLSRLSAFTLDHHNIQANKQTKSNLERVSLDLY